MPQTDSQMVTNVSSPLPDAWVTSCGPDPYRVTVEGLRCPHTQPNPSGHPSWTYKGGCHRSEGSEGDKVNLMDN